MEFQLHRFYENEFPDVGDCVMVKVDRIDDNNIGVYVNLMEYGGIEAMVQLSELSRRRIKSIHHLIRIGKLEVLSVLRVDRNRGYLDLSKRTVNEQDIEATKQKYRDGKLINTIMNQVALETNIELRSLYESLVWPLYQQHNVLTTLQAATVDPSVLEDFNLSAPILSSITKQCQKYMKPKMLKLNAHVQVTCFTPEGIDVIKDGFALAIQDSNPPVKATLIAPPVYLLSTECMDKQSGIDVLTRSLDLLGELVTSRGGQVEIKKQPDVMHQDDERQLGAIIERLNQHNQEVDGDDIGDD